MIKDMTEGTPSKVLLSFAVPMMLSGMFQQFYNIADSVIAGQFAGSNAVAAVGASYPITMLFIAIATGSGVGCSVIVSNFFGAKDYSKLKTTIATSIITIILLSLGLTLLGTIICNPLMHLMNTPSDIFGDSALYLRIYIWGLIFLFVYNITTSIFNGLGDSKTPLYFLIFSSLFNVVLDYVFVANFSLGVAGVAWATFIAQGISSILSIGCLIGRIKKLKTTEHYEYFSWSILGHISHIALPSILQQSIVSIGQLLVQALVNSYGTTVLYGYSAAIKIDSFFKIVIISMGNAVSNFTAQNLGGQKPKRVKKGYTSSLFVMLIYCIVAFIICLVFSPSLISIFLDSKTDPALIKDVISIGTSYMMIVSAGYFACAVLLVNNGILRGSAYMLGFTTATLTDLFVRVGAAYILAHWFGYSAIWYSIPLGWSIGTLVSFGFCFKNTHKLSLYSS